jgi:hypothetical protein
VCVEGLDELYDPMVCEFGRKEGITLPYNVFKDLKNYKILQRDMIKLIVC